MAAISALLQQAFIASQAFRDQVNAVVKEQALVKAEADSPGQFNSALSAVIKSPESFGFPSTLVADAGWAVTYDQWAADPKSADYSILVGVQKWFNLLTNYVAPQPPPP